MYDDVAALRPYKAAADALAARADWGQLYSTPVLATNRVPAAAVAYVEDMYVDHAASMVRSLATAQTLGSVHACCAGRGALKPARFMWQFALLLGV